MPADPGQHGAFPRPRARLQAHLAPRVVLTPQQQQRVALPLVGLGPEVVDHEGDRVGTPLANPLVRALQVAHGVSGSGSCPCPATNCSSPILPLCSCSTLDFRSEEHTSELQSLMRISYAVFCLKKKKK